MIQYSDNFKFAYIDNIKFVRDNKTGYYLYSTKKIRLHRYIYEKNNGKIPNGFQIHHIDKNKNNNEIDNLQLIQTSKHYSLHAKEKAQNNPEWIKAFQLLGTKKAPEWHKSQAGYEWHKSHYELMKDKLFIKKDYTCLCCGSNFKSNKLNSKFCCNNCKSKYRVKQGIDNIIKICPICNKEFQINKYAKQITCSRSCANRMRVYKNKND